MEFGCTQENLAMTTFTNNFPQAENGFPTETE